jgi:hypothetical protein
MVVHGDLFWVVMWCKEIKSTGRGPRSTKIADGNGGNFDAIVFYRKIAIPYPYPYFLKRKYI